MNMIATEFPTLTNPQALSTVPELREALSQANQNLLHMIARQAGLQEVIDSHYARLVRQSDVLKSILNCYLEEGDLTEILKPLTEEYEAHMQREAQKFASWMTGEKNDH